MSTSKPFRSALACPKCGDHRSEVTDSRGVQTASLIRRRRSCQNCGERWTTVEISAEDFEGIARKAKILNQTAEAMHGLANCMQKAAAQ